MIKIKVFAPAIIDHSKLDANSFLLLEDGTTLRRLFKLLKVPLLLQPILFCTVNYDRVKMSTVLKDGDTVSFIAPISGGSTHQIQS
jgi:molybdopterin converting factor small subunit